MYKNTTLKTTQKYEEKFKTPSQIGPKIETR